MCCKFEHISIKYHLRIILGITFDCVSSTIYTKYYVIWKLQCLQKIFCLNIPILKVKRWFLSIPLKHWSSPNILGSIRIMIVFSFLFFSKFLFLFVRLFPLNSNRIFFCLCVTSHQLVDCCRCVDNYMTCVYFFYFDLAFNFCHVF